MAGSIIDTTYFKNLVSTVKTEADIRQEVRKQHEAGVDYIKLYNSLEPDQLEYAINQAHNMGLGTIGDLESTSWTEAVKRGLDNIVHIIPGNENLLPSQHREEFTKSISMGTQKFYKWFEFVDLNSSEINEMIRTSESTTFPWIQHWSFSIRYFLPTKVSISKTNALQYVPDVMVENWKTFNFNIGWTEEDYERAHVAWSKVEEFTKLLHDSGIMLTAGTDANNPWVPAGESFHGNLNSLQQPGFRTVMC